MKNSISYLLILIGGSIAIYANARDDQNVILLVIGIVLLMFGVYQLNIKLTSKPLENDYEIKEEEE